MKDLLIKISIFFQVLDIRSKIKAMIFLTKLIINWTQIFHKKITIFMIKILKANQKVNIAIKVLIFKRVSLLFQII